MSTAARELEELRRIREEQKRQAEEQKRIEDEKQAKLAKKNEFLSRAAMFQQKKGPTEEEIREKVKRESSGRKFGRQLDKMLKGGPKSHLSAMDNNYDEEEGAGEGGFRPPPPPPVKLMIPPPPPPPPKAPAGIPPPPPPPKAPEEETSTSEVYFEQDSQPAAQEEPEEAATPVPFSGWVYVFENEATPYYWNMNNNATSFDPPPEYNGELYVGGQVVARTEAASNEENATVVMWQEVYLDSGEVYYLNTTDSSTTYTRPAGDVYVVVQTEDGGEENWQEGVAEDGSVFYTSLVSGQVTADKPVGVTVVAQHV